VTEALLRSGHKEPLKKVRRSTRVQRLDCALQGSRLGRFSRAGRSELHARKLASRGVGHVDGRASASTRRWWVELSLSRRRNSFTRVTAAHHAACLSSHTGQLGDGRNVALTKHARAMLPPTCVWLAPADDRAPLYADWLGDQGVPDP
jgi:hypothetical protein